MKLTDVKLVAHTGDHESLFNKEHPREGGERSYFPHVHVGADECARPRYYEPSSSSHYRGTKDYKPHFEQCHRNTMTFNEGGDYDNVHEVHDALAELFAAAPRMLLLLKQLTDAAVDDTAGAHQRLVTLAASAKPLVDRLLAYEITQERDGYGPYFNADGTPYEETP